MTLKSLEKPSSVSPALDQMLEFYECGPKQQVEKVPFEKNLWHPNSVASHLVSGVCANHVEKF